MAQPSPLPAELTQLATQRWQQLSELSSFNPDWHQHQPLIQRAFALSDFIFNQCMASAATLDDLLNQGPAEQLATSFQASLADRLSRVSNDIELKQVLRQFRHRQMCKIAWLDLLNLQSIEQSLVQVSELARQLITQANDWLYANLAERYGVPQGEHGPQPLLIIGMGKLGGGELNFSSDIDLIFSYPAQGETSGGRQSIEHQQFFTKLAQALISALHQITVDGQVYRVDMRLRPLGDSGPLVMQFDALEDYYQEQGREWERYAMLKGKVLNQPSAYSAELEQILKPFIYRRYLDFSAIESLRNMKALIQQEIRRRGLVNNIKLGQGGIREAEFIVQSLQLIRGGREASLQNQSILTAIRRLTDSAIMSAQDAGQLQSSYLWLRKVEHCLQQFDDKQTQLLPDDSLDQQRLYYVMQCASYAEFIQRLQQCMDYIQSQFVILIGEEQNEQSAPLSQEQQSVIDLWHLELDSDESQPLLERWLSPDDAGAFAHILREFKHKLSSSRVGQRGINTLNSLMPILLLQILEMRGESALERLTRVLQVFDAILGRTAYLELLLANQGALNQLVKLCSASPWVTSELARFPLLLDELINPATLYNPIALQEYPEELRRAMLRVESQDLELQMETLRQFKLSQQLKIAAADIAEALPIMKISDHLTYLAEAIIHHVIDIAWQQMAEKHGEPVCARAGQRSLQDKSFAVFGFGKLGGWELGYGSDLDLVFVHNCEGNQPTNGLKPIESSAFYFKLAQRILHIFTTKTGLGLLYEIDMRLRPSGQAGLLVCHFNGFAAYQQQEAWTWEHQALCRARFICGDQQIRHDFNQLREEVLSKSRALPLLREQVRDMRLKMRQHLAKGNAELLDLKQDSGGMVDIEFIVQYLTLAHCNEVKQIAQWTDNVRVLESLVAAGFISQSDASELKAAYLNYRNYMHRLTLQQKNLANREPELLAHQAKVQHIWQQIMHDE